MQQAFNKLQKDFDKKFGEGKMFLASEAPKLQVISTGIPSVDYALGVGGIPRGGIVEIFGRESVGKTAFAYYMIAEAQKAIKKSGEDRGVGFVNLEGNFDPRWARRIANIDLSNLLMVTPTPGTETVNMLAKMIDSGAFDLIVFDSLGAMMDDSEIALDGSKRVGGASGIITHMMEKTMMLASKNNCSVVFINQVRDLMSAMHATETTPGGHGVRHAAAVRMHLKPGSPKDGATAKVNGEDTQVMFRVNSVITKSKIGAPRQKTGWNFWNYDINGFVGIDIKQNLIDLARATDVIKASGAWCYHDAFPKGQLNGSNAVSEYLRNQEDAFEIIRNEVMEHAYKQYEVDIEKSVGLVEDDRKVMETLV